ncbi:MAG: hypothetical protein AB7Q00_16250 [Phycisphaerales bacterium]
MKTKHWHGDLRNTVNFLNSLKEKHSLIVEVGAGNAPTRIATQHAGREVALTQKVCEQAGIEAIYFDLDLESDYLAWQEQSVDLLVCRHTLEDLLNPGHLLHGIQRCARGVYLETPSPLAELSRDTDAGEDVPWRGYRHHHWICWSAGGIFHLLPKHSLVEHILPEQDLGDLSIPDHWITRHYSETPVEFKVYRNELDYHLGDPNSYLHLLVAALKRVSPI